jgi:cytochrome P450
MEDLGRLSYTSWVFDEALRLYPQNWVMSRHTIDEDTLGGCSTRAGASAACVASMEATLVLARLARRFHVEVAPSVTVRPRPSFALRPRDGVPVRLRAM